MGLERLQENVREWVSRAFVSGDAIRELGRHCVDPKTAIRPPIADKSYQRNVTRLVYQLREPEKRYTSPTKRLWEKTEIPGLGSRVMRTYQSSGPSANDSGFLMFRQPDQEEDLSLARIYVNFDHANLAHSCRLAGYLQRELVAGTRGLLHFKIAGPDMNPERRDSAVLFLVKRGLECKEELARTITALIPVNRSAAYGTQELQPGIGFAFSPKDLENGDWKTGFHSPPVSFGLFIAIYLAKALLEKPGTLDAYADRIASLLQADGIAPLHVYNLSPKTQRLFPHSEDSREGTAASVGNAHTDYPGETRTR